MGVLKINDFEKQSEDTVIFPMFNLEISEGQSVSIYSNTNVRNVLLNTFLGKMSVTYGDISVNGEKVDIHNRAYYMQIGISFLNEGIYERLSVKDNFKFYKGLYGSNYHIEEVLQLVQLGEKEHKKVKRLSYSEKKRVHLARIIFQSPALFIFEEPDQNVDIETKNIFIKILKELQQQGKSILVLTGNMESAITLTDQAYSLDENGLQILEVESEKNPNDLAVSQEKHVSKEQLTHSIRFEKIPTKSNNKIILFDPTEIDYIESSVGHVNIHIKGEEFLGLFTLNEFEERLVQFGFFRCHRSYIVNLQKVCEVITWTRNSYCLILDDQTEIPLSKTKMAELKELVGMK
ncbi:LytTR family transcriptional regulator DNA-binding domain-containing protein [Cytobacillus sp. Hz8]|uniref:LytTR family transcriptional regulator DNA-binding domain-containing protein n=1 Tax=Cytobacillus sp. Hz8 TaxID=3347168 RepID=UPI0035E23CD0